MKNKLTFWITFFIAFCLMLLLFFGEPLLARKFGSHPFLYRAILVLVVSLLSGGVANYISYKYKKKHE
jgi:uncharacterized membrane protein